MKDAGYTGEPTNAGGYEDLDSAGLDTQTSECRTARTSSGGRRERWTEL